ncbi:aminoglycoside phosphotransferase family protein [Thiosulfativibrio zosterae]|uniref:Aminoglycoside phosphotransferase n=1 Tax=Thiosulfativibrio zosterae TaxID=2675053 RepID=A0A6F8PLN2_9GAMM|nr:phosphotransferase [Thiosulfativibrio zosterae]BBP43012.1 aminoglycoside phosphotransferase [Thiosulfativibrio zosterae]
MTERFERMCDWLATCEPLKNQTYSQPVAASSDASFRRYFRCEVASHTQTGQRHSYIIMDAPPSHEDCKPFIRVSEQLHAMGLNVPQVLAQDLTLGFLLLSDLGNTTYLSVLNEQTVDGYYSDAFDALITLQQKGKAYQATLPLYHETLLTNEMSLFSDWLCQSHLELSLGKLETQAWQSVQTHLIKSAQQQPQNFVHRDYHSRNLMVTSEQANTGRNPGILDFQDAVWGGVTYDVVSLIRDCYIKWPEEQVKEWQRAYFLKACEGHLFLKNEWEGFVKAMDFMGVQRHLKAAGIFARLYHRDGKDGYLKDIPTTLSYIVEQASAYSELKDLAKLVENRVLPAMDNLKP